MNVRIASWKTRVSSSEAQQAPDKNTVRSGVMVSAIRIHVGLDLDLRNGMSFRTLLRVLLSIAGMLPYLEHD